MSNSTRKIYNKNYLFVADNVIYGINEYDFYNIKKLYDYSDIEQRAMFINHLISESILHQNNVEILSY